MQMFKMNTLMQTEYGNYERPFFYLLQIDVTNKIEDNYKHA